MDRFLSEEDEIAIHDPAPKLTDGDFGPINFGILIADKYDYTFVYQIPLPYDKSRHAQTSPCYIINHGDPIDVKDFDEALEGMNSWLMRELG